MSSSLTESIMTPTFWMWLAASVGAAIILISALHGRRTRLVTALKSYVDRYRIDSGPNEQDKKRPKG